MKKILFLPLMGCFMLFSCSQTPKTQVVDNQPLSKEIAAENLTENTFNIEGMQCQMGCANRIETTLSKTEGIKTASVDFEAKTAVVQYDKTLLNPEKIKNIIEKLNGGNAYKVTF